MVANNSDSKCSQTIHQREMVNGPRFSDSEILEIWKFGSLYNSSVFDHLVLLTSALCSILVGYPFSIVMLLKKFMNRNNKEEADAAPAAEPSEEALAKEEEEAVKDEKRLKRVLEMARRHFFEKRIVGSIDVARSFGIFTAGASCDIDGTEAEEELAEEVEKEEDKEKLSRFERIIMSSLTKAVNALESRAKAYRHRPYKKDLSLSTGIYVTDPFLGISTLSVTCTATVTSLLAMGEGKPSSK